MNPEKPKGTACLPQQMTDEDIDHDQECIDLARRQQDAIEGEWEEVMVRELREFSNN